MKRKVNILKRPEKIGKLTVLQAQKSACDYVHICQCECGQICFLSSSQVQRKSKLSCDRCLEPDYKFSINEIAVVEFSLFTIPKGEQVIITNVSGNQVRVEYRGKCFDGASFYFKSLGLRF